MMSIGKIYHLTVVPASISVLKNANDFGSTICEIDYLVLGVPTSTLIYKLNAYPPYVNLIGKLESMFIVPT